MPELKFRQSALEVVILLGVAIFIRLIGRQQEQRNKRKQVVRHPYF